MTLPADPPKLPKWPFLVGDVVLLGVAAAIAQKSPNAFAPATLIAVVACVVVGAVIATYPFVIEYTRSQEVALDDRQRSLETLSSTVATSAEQISIVANGLHEISELAQRNLKVAEQLPMKIQEKLAGVSAGFEDSRADEREELEREVASLRAAESEQLTAAADKISRLIAELTKIEVSAQKQLTAAAAAIARISDALTPLDATISASIARAERVLADTNLSLSDERRGRAVNLSADSNASQEPEASKNYPDPLPPEVHEVPQTSEGLRSADPFAAEVMDAHQGSSSANGLAPSSIPEVLAAPEPAPIPTQSITEIVPVAPRDSASNAPMLLPADSSLMKAGRKRAPRKPKSVPAPEAAPESVPPAAVVEPEFSPVGTAVALPEPAFAPPEPIAEIVAPAAPELENVVAFEPAPAPVEPDVAEIKSSEPAEPVESAVSSDGATRLLVTAYIGIGNRLFIRGDGAGLSWEKGIPLQFVSIGKWRWENHDNSGPVAYKLFKNDSVECTALGQQSLPAGSQSEVTAKF